MRPGKRRELDNDFNEAVIEESKNLRASACAKVELRFTLSSVLAVPDQPNNVCGQLTAYLAPSARV